MGFGKDGCRLLIGIASAVKTGNDQAHSILDLYVVTIRDSMCPNTAENGQDDKTQHDGRTDQSMPFPLSIFQ